MSEYPKVKGSNLIGKYPASVNSGDRYVWEEVLEYRVWCHPRDGAADGEEDNDYYYTFATYEESFKF